MRRLIVVAAAVLGGVVLLGLLSGGAGVGNDVPVSAQNSCDDPFAGETVRFNTNYWTLTDFCQRSVPLGEFRSGGPPPDGIPPIDDPQFESIAIARGWLEPQSPVIKVEINGEAKAYPLSVLIWHEIANDELGGVPIAATFCPLCNSAIVFDRTVRDEVLDFGVSGNLRNSDLVMYDRQTESWWQQFTGEALVGEYTGTNLEIIPSLVIGFGQFAEQYPEGLVLSRDTGASRNYGANPYVGYDQTSDPFLFEGEVDRRLPATAHVLAGMIGGEAVAYPFDSLVREVVINDTVGGRPVVALWQSGVVSALDSRDIDASRDVGMAALYDRTLDGQTLSFTFDGEVIRDNETNSVWNTFGQATEGELAGSQLQLQVAAPHFWFAWAAFQPDTFVYGLE
ncbi:MAG: DUF3179 domain-containing protein [Chloroflexi bacterium]|nr:DUF3179 domain-containing protein [Chloroflexota bacterium]